MRLSLAPLFLAALGVVPLLFALPSDAAPPTLRAGAAKVKITPSLDRTVYIAGYDNNRVADSVHDDLWARALVLDDGRTRIALVMCDLIGLSNYRIRKIREQVRSVPPDHVLIACTHTHSGPDTLGLWGKAIGVSGLDPAYMDQLQARVVEAVEEAAKELRPVTVSAARVTVPDGLVHNIREPIQDKELTALRFTDERGRTVASVVHYGGHPEVNKTRAMTADFVGVARDVVEKRFGGVALYVNGALGGMVTADIKEHTWPEMERVGEGVGRSAVEALEQARPVTVDHLAVRRRDVQMPLENINFRVMHAAKVLEGAEIDGGLLTEVWRVDLGPITLISIPGEILPKPELALKAKMPGPFPMIVALGNDELGYILDPEDYPKQLYHYERSMSVGPRTWTLLEQAAEELLR